jgi:hypothetical protein
VNLWEQVIHGEGEPADRTRPKTMTLAELQRVVREPGGSICGRGLARVGKVDELQRCAVLRAEKSCAIQRVVPPRGEVGYGEDGVRGHDKSFRNG